MNQKVAMDVLKIMNLNYFRKLMGSIGNFSKIHRSVCKHESFVGESLNEIKNVLQKYQLSVSKTS